MNSWSELFCIQVMAGIQSRLNKWFFMRGCRWLLQIRRTCRVIRSIFVMKMWKCQSSRKRAMEKVLDVGSSEITIYDGSWTSFFRLDVASNLGKLLFKSARILWHIRKIYIIIRISCLLTLLNPFKVWSSRTKSSSPSPTIVFSHMHHAYGRIVRSSGQSLK